MTCPNCGHDPAATGRAVADEVNRKRRERDRLSGRLSDFASASRVMEVAAIREQFAKMAEEAKQANALLIRLERRLRDERGEAS